MLTFWSRSDQPQLICITHLPRHLMFLRSRSPVLFLVCFFCCCCFFHDATPKNLQKNESIILRRSRENIGVVCRRACCCRRVPTFLGTRLVGCWCVITDLLTIWDDAACWGGGDIILWDFIPPCLCCTSSITAAAHIWTGYRCGKRWRRSGCCMSTCPRCSTWIT